MLMNGSFFAIQSVFIILYLIGVILLIYWMVKMLRNSNENLQLQREILELLRKRDQQQ